MKQAGYSKRQNSRSSERHRQQPKQMNGHSSELRVRGNAQQCVDKYLTLARESASSGDPISAENYYQYADHYYRIALANRPSKLPYTRKMNEEGAQEPQLDKVREGATLAPSLQEADSLPLS